MHLFETSWSRWSKCSQECWPIGWYLLSFVSSIYTYTLIIYTIIYYYIIISPPDFALQDPTVILFGLANFVVFAAMTELQYDPDVARQRHNEPPGGAEKRGENPGEDGIYRGKMVTVHEKWWFSLENCDIPWKNSEFLKRIVIVLGQIVSFLGKHLIFPQLWWVYPKMHGENVNMVKLKCWIFNRTFWELKSAGMSG